MPVACASLFASPFIGAVIYVATHSVAWSVIATPFVFSTLVGAVVIAPCLGRRG